MRGRGFEVEVVEVSREEREKRKCFEDRLFFDDVSNIKGLGLLDE